MSNNNHLDAAAWGAFRRWFYIVAIALLALLALLWLAGYGPGGSKCKLPASASVAPAAAVAPTTPAATAVAAAPAVAATPVSVAPAPAMEWPAKVYFSTGKSDINAQGQATIAAAAAALMADGGKKIGITGYTDKTGNADANVELAKLRAVGVRDALKAAGVAEDRITMQPPIFVEAGKQGADAEARRVEIKLL